MAEKLVIEIFKDKPVAELAKNISEPDSKLETGSAAAVCAAFASALLERAAIFAQSADSEDECAAYVSKNAGILRDYMAHLIDEDVKSRAVLKRAMKEGGEREIEAARHPAGAICAEIVNMMCKCISLASELHPHCPKEALHYLAESAEMALGAMKAAGIYAVDMADKCSDDTYRYIIRRENELMIQDAEKSARELVSKLMQEI